MEKNSMPMKTFIFIWIGQFVSLLGSSLTSFALGIWVYQNTKSVTLYTLVLLSAVLPPILFSPFIGALVDRWPRRWVMILSDAGAGIGTLLLTLLLIFGKLEVWSVCIISAISTLCSSFQQPAYSAAIALLVPKEYLDRANSMVQVGDAVSSIIAPVLGGVLLVSIKLEGVILIDFVTFLLALIPLLLLKFPEAEVIPGKQDRETSLFREAVSGWTYIAERPGFLGLLIFLALSTFLVEVVVTLFTPFILSFSSPATLGTIISIGSFGALLSSLLISIRGVPKPLISGIFGFEMLGGLCIFMIGVSNSIPLITGAVCLFLVGAPIVSICVETIFQTKVARDFQGRVFATSQMITGLSSALALIVAGPLTDRVFEPLMASNSGFLAGSVGQIIGTGPGRGIGLIFIFMGAMSILLTALAYQYPRLRLVENELPDAI
jgi:MFS transporter, DHA3 family, macrolide efflux protein